MIICCGCCLPLGAFLLIYYNMFHNTKYKHIQCDPNYRSPENWVKLDIWLFKIRILSGYASIQINLSKQNFYAFMTIFLCFQILTFMRCGKFIDTFGARSQKMLFLSDQMTFDQILFDQQGTIFCMICIEQVTQFCWPTFRRSL